MLTRCEGTELMNYSPFIYAFEQQNIAVTGRARSTARPSDSTGGLEGARGVRLDAGDAEQAPARHRLLEHGRAWRAGRRTRVRRGALPAAELHPAVSLPQRAHRGRHDHQLADVGDPSRCSARTSPCAACTIDSHGPNNDGCDPESCRDVLIEGCTFDTGDDCIAIKSGRNADGRRVNVPSENIVDPRLRR